MKILAIFSSIFKFCTSHVQEQCGFLYVCMYVCASMCVHVKFLPSGTPDGHWTVVVLYKVKHALLIFRTIHFPAHCIFKIFTVVKTKPLIFPQNWNCVMQFLYSSFCEHSYINLTISSRSEIRIQKNQKYHMTWPSLIIIAIDVWYDFEIIHSMRNSNYIL